MFIRCAKKLAVTMMLAGCAAIAAQEWSGRYVDVAGMDAMAERVEERLINETDAANFHKYQPLSIAFVAGGTYSRPFVDVRLDAIITAPSGAMFCVPAFYDGMGTWKFRFMPYETGEYHYQTNCNKTKDTGLHGRRGSFTVGDPLAGTELSEHGGHLRVGANRRHLTYTDSAPFFWLSDTYWFVPTSHMPYDSSSNPHFKSMYQLCVALRKKQQFNALTIGFLGDRMELQTKKEPDPGSFHGKDDLWGVDTWTEDAIAFWRKADRYILYANEAGFVVTMNLIWANDFLKYLNAGKTREELVEMVKPVHRYVIARLGSYNVLWHITAEYNHGDNIKADLKGEHLQVGQFVREIDPYKDRPMTIFSWPGHMASAEDAFREDWYQLRLAQGGHFRSPWETASYKWLLEWYNHERIMPLLVGEHNFERIYEKENDSGDVRAAAWHGMMCGSCGYTYGATGLWYPNRDENDTSMGTWGNVAWWQALDYPGAGQMGVMRSFFEQYRWWEMEPCLDLVRVVPSQQADHNMPTSRRLGDELLVIYVPGSLAHDAKILVRSSAAKQQCWFFNPRDGKKTKPVALAMPKEADGLIPLPQRPDDLDWVIVVQ